MCTQLGTQALTVVCASPKGRHAQVVTSDYPWHTLSGVHTRDPRITSMRPEQSMPFTQFLAISISAEFLHVSISNRSFVKQRGCCHGVSVAPGHYGSAPGDGRRTPCEAWICCTFLSSSCTALFLLLEPVLIPASTAQASCEV